jgi:3'-phosphoadenosine 5'-phosphosulfate sulfotransferase (PAPS reductase)/FAD synthetase
VQNLVASISGGETSGYLAVLLSGNSFPFLRNAKKTYIFANTGLENEETYEFVNSLDVMFDLNLIWVEAVINPKHGKGVTHRVTDFENAFRPHQYKHPDHPFHAHIRKSGIPNPNKPQCSDRLKAFAIEDYKKKNGLKGAPHAIGMRGDEPNRIMSKKLRDMACSIGVNPDYWRQLDSHYERMSHINKHVIASDYLPFLERYSKKLEQFGLVYPLSDWTDEPVDKAEVNAFWEEADHRLELEEHEGNCQTCWKKSDPKLFLLANEHGSRFDPFKWFEEQYHTVKPNDNGESRVFFRRNRSAINVMRQAKEHSSWALRKMIGLHRVDENAGCSESCESYNLELNL